RAGDPTELPVTTHASIGGTGDHTTRSDIDEVHVASPLKPLTSDRSGQYRGSGSQRYGNQPAGKRGTTRPGVATAQRSGDVTSHHFRREVHMHDHTTPGWVDASSLTAPVSRLLDVDVDSIESWSGERLVGGAGEALGVWRISGTARTSGTT